MTLALTGDVMLGRLVDQSVITNPSVAPTQVWGDVLPLLLGADRRLINLECVISTRGQKWRPATKAFHFRTHPRAIEFLRAAQIDCVTLANNHVLDYGIEAMLECMTLLDRAGIRRAGAGRTLTEALTPAILDVPRNRFAVVGVMDDVPPWAATDTTPGVSYIEYGPDGLREPFRSRLAKVITLAKRQAQIVIVSAHVGPNWGTPSASMRALAHELIDLGADLYWGHSNHTPQGIETYKGKFILYSTGDFIDDYAVDPDERNDLSFLFLVDIERQGVVRIRLHPVRIENFRVRRAQGKEVAFLQESMQRKCAALGSTVEFQRGVGTVALG
jgi:poly-gamma-glutamate capsule biosynthesis protein CapA/YwtB (metallophosphatase superfamily)